MWAETIRPILSLEYGAMTTRPIDFDQLQTEALDICQKIKQRVPSANNKEIGKFAKWTVLAREAIERANAHLAKDGKALSEEGYRMIFTEVGEFVFGTAEH